MKRRLAVALLLGSLVAGCGVTPTQPFFYGDAPTNRVQGAQVYFRFDQRPYKVLRPSTRDLTPAERLDLLFAGPTDVERTAGLSTALPDGYVVLSRLTSPVGSPQPEVVVVDRPDGVDLTRFGKEAGEQIACTMANGVSPFAVVVHDTTGRERGPYACEQVEPRYVPPSTSSTPR